MRGFERAQQQYERELPAYLEEGYAADLDDDWADEARELEDEG